MVWCTEDLYEELTDKVTIFNNEFKDYTEALRKEILKEEDELLKEHQLDFLNFIITNKDENYIPELDSFISTVKVDEDLADCCIIVITIFIARLRRDALTINKRSLDKSLRIINESYSILLTALTKNLVYKQKRL